MCCMQTDIKSIKEEFNKKLKYLLQSKDNKICNDTNIEFVIGEKCQYTNSNL